MPATDMLASSCGSRAGQHGHQKAVGRRWFAAAACRRRRRRRVMPRGGSTAADDEAPAISAPWHPPGGPDRPATGGDGMDGLGRSPVAGLSCWFHSPRSGWCRRRAPSPPLSRSFAAGALTLPE